MATWLTFVPALSLSAATPETLRVVTLTDQAAPGTASGVGFAAFNPPILNIAGQAAFSATLTGIAVTPNNDTGIWSEGSGSLQQVAREESAAPGAGPGANFAILSLFNLNASGDTGFWGSLIAAQSTFEREYGIWVGGTGSLTLVVQRGNTAPGIEQGVNFDLFGGTALNDRGETAFQAVLKGIGVTPNNDNGIWSERLGGISLVAREGNQAPGTEAGVVFGDLTEPLINSAGQTAFRGTLTGTGVTFINDSGIWSEGSGSLRLVAREGSTAPGAGAGVNFNSFGSGQIAFNSAGRTAFYATLTGLGVSGLNNNGIWSEGDGELELIARAGNSAPNAGPGVHFRNFSRTVLNGAGHTSFMAELTGVGVTTANNTSVWREVPGGLVLVAREGDAAPGTEPGVSFDDFDFFAHSLAMNRVGQAAFHAYLKGSGVVASNDSGIWAEDTEGTLTLIVREGGRIEVMPEDFRIVSDLRFIGGSGLEDGLGVGLNELGQVAFRASFVDGSHGIFVSNLVAVPEPCTLALTTAGSFGLLALMRQRRRLRGRVVQ